MNIDVSSINWLAVVVAAFATFMLGGVWYTALCGKVWQRLNGYTDEKLVEMRKKRPPPVFFGTMIGCYLVVSLLMAMMVGAFEITHYLTGAAFGMFIFGIAAAVQVTGQIASDKPMRALVIDLAYQAIYMPMTGAILASWH
ncbi:MAG: DUF1761 domain-containing protein [Phycisphaeraceae bacterium]|nr:DUF1761 domain-containing protein [Phycisphaeraceae bacterium]MCW5769039.1 DUF1761 domain-containing protein [Phycisphaeraceae bacterium]